jgi:predicted transcriptional regulator
LTAQISGDEVSAGGGDSAEEYLSINDAAAKYGVSAGIIRRAVSDGLVRLKPHRWGAQVRGSDVARLAASPPSPAVTTAPGASVGPARRVRGLGRLQSKIVEILGERGEASIRDLQEWLRSDHPIGYAAVATTTRLMHERGLLTRTRRGRGYVYALNPNPEPPTTVPHHPASASTRPPRRIAVPPHGYIMNPELETAILSALGELGQATLAELHHSVITRYHATYPDMLAAVRSLMSRGLVTKQSGSRRNLYQVSEVGATQ